MPCVEVIEDTRPGGGELSLRLCRPRALLARVKAARLQGHLVGDDGRGSARWLEQHGVDAVIAQGYEAGGHRGMFLDCNRDRAVALQIGTMALAPQIADAARSACR